MATINVGKVRLSFEGDYNPAVSYAVLECVLYLGESFACIQDASAGTTPTNATHWAKMSGKGDTGPAGVTGAAGPSGIDGSDGVQGNLGPTGPQGATGLTGVQGATGIQGTVGPEGSLGPDGSTGPQGAAGPQGDVGNTGSMGPSGNTGSTGPQGATGPQGNTGSAGSNGSTGTNGSTGATGPAGSNGSTGATGPAGFLSAATGTWSSIGIGHPNNVYAPAGNGWYLIQDSNDWTMKGTNAFSSLDNRTGKGNTQVFYWDNANHWLKGRSWTAYTLYYQKLT